MWGEGCCVGLVEWEFFTRVKSVDGPLSSLFVGVDNIELTVCELWRFFPPLRPVGKGPCAFVVGRFESLKVSVVNFGIEVSRREIGFRDESVGKRPFSGAIDAGVGNNLAPVLDVMNLLVFGEDALLP